MNHFEDGVVLPHLHRSALFCRSAINPCGAVSPNHTFDGFEKLVLFAARLCQRVERLFTGLPLTRLPQQGAVYHLSILVSERFRNACVLFRVAKGGIYFHLSDEDLSPGTPDRKKPLGGCGFALQQLENRCRHSLFS
jgi:hypothetical protein